MNRIKYAVVAFVAISGVFFILTAAVIFLVPPLIDNSFVGNKIRREISALVEGEFNYDRLDIAVFPSPMQYLLSPKYGCQVNFQRRWIPLNCIWTSSHH